MMMMMMMMLMMMMMIIMMEEAILTHEFAARKIPATGANVATYDSHLLFAEVQFSFCQLAVKSLLCCQLLNKKVNF